jgi:hypothetical protein
MSGSDNSSEYKARFLRLITIGVKDKCLVLLAIILAFVLAFMFELLTFALGWAGITLAVGIFLPFEYVDKVEVLVKSLNTKKSICYLFNIRFYSLFSGFFILGVWFVDECLRVLLVLDTQIFVFVGSLLSIILFSIAVYNVVRLLDIWRSWLLKELESGLSTTCE